ncbi:MAG: tRNA lysidine(34) synthetase TilS [Candidatus Cryptobacteroides sp.]
MRLLLAVSGGIDSMYMAEKALEGGLFAVCGPCEEFAVAHCNFCLRGEESLGDEEFVRNWCREKGVAFFCRRFGTAEYASVKKISIEMAARELRYGWFEELCREKGFDATVLAHNANDNAETLLLNMLRGCGSRGMKGMSSDSGAFPQRLLRPMLSLSREEIRCYMEQKGLKWREDSSNSTNLYKRNCIRHKVLPVFKELNPSCLQTLASDMKHIAEVHGIAEDFYQKKRNIFRMSDSALWSCNIEELLSVPHWKYLLFRELEQYGFGPASIDGLAELLESGRTVSGKEFNSPQGFRLDIGRGSLHLSENSSPKSAPQLIEIEGAGEYEVAGRRFKISIGPCPESFVPPQGSLYFALDFPFVLRNWKDGDWMQPLGLRGRKKISDLFVDLKIPAFEKDKAVVLARNAEESEVLALLPLRISEKVKIKKSQTAKVLTISEL